MPFSFVVEKESLKRQYAVYVVVAKRRKQIMLYVGKTGDNRDGCNPVISRCGNHFSYNNLHSQIRNKIPEHEEWRYTYIFDHFGEYRAGASRRHLAVEQINEMERWLNAEVQKCLQYFPSCTLLNPFGDRTYVSKRERDRRCSFRTRAAGRRIRGIVAAVSKELGRPA